MIKITFVIALILSITSIKAQEKMNTTELPYYEVPEYYSEYTVGTVTARMIDDWVFVTVGRLKI